MRVRYSQFTRFPTFIAVLALSAVAACSSDSPTGTTGAIVTGTYTLQTVDGVALPAPAKDSTGAIAGTAISGSVTLTASSFTSTINYTLTNGSPASISGSGTYSVSGSTVTFVNTGSGGSGATASYTNGNSLTFKINAQAYVFKTA